MIRERLCVSRSRSFHLRLLTHIKADLCTRTRKMEPWTTAFCVLDSHVEVSQSRTYLRGTIWVVVRAKQHISKGSRAHFSLSIAFPDIKVRQDFKQSHCNPCGKQRIHRNCADLYFTLLRGVVSLPIPSAPVKPLKAGLRTRGAELVMPPSSIL